ncbi:hypothetical protein CYMTET_38333 [Cymbomonas tetramitiformis]|uniref:Uncharacterized protein n=1 Tax=Cymbomonas tetramitiformis TaxID=36881 RepID=A0AAE0CEC6_9CHLO|nr:hypothetical protein CYMTET_38333 [Cymbomonas tetramitiformis]
MDPSTTAFPLTPLDPSPPTASTAPGPSGPSTTTFPLTPSDPSPPIASIAGVSTGQVVDVYQPVPDVPFGVPFSAPVSMQPHATSMQPHATSMQPHATGMQPSMFQGQFLHGPSPAPPFVFQQQEGGWGSVQQHATWQAEHATRQPQHATWQAEHATRQPPGLWPYGMPHHYAPGVLTHAPYTPAPMSTTYGDPWTLPAYFPPPPPSTYGVDPASEARAREWWAARERMAAAERAVATDMRVVPQRLYPTPLMEPTPHTDTSPDEGVVNHQPHHRRRASGPETLGRTLPIHTEPQDVVTEDLSQAHASQPGSTTSGSGYESAAGTQHSRRRR